MKTPGGGREAVGGSGAEGPLPRKALGTLH